MKYKAVIFDMDGTIVDTEGIWKHATRVVIERYSPLSLTPEIEKELRFKIAGLYNAKACQLIIDMFQMPIALEDLMKKKSAIAHDLYAQNVRFMEGFIEFHALLCANNIKTALATNAHAETVVITDKKLDLRRYFGDHIYSIGDVQNRGKPSPLIYLHTAEKIGIDPEYCIAIEDSAHGVTAAQAAGMFCIGFNGAQRPEQVHRADVIIDAFHHINIETLLHRAAKVGK